MSSPPSRRLAPATLTFVIMACTYAWLLCPSLYWLDSGELAAASWELGLLHAPGHPLALLVGKAIAFVPVGDLALRAGLAQVFCGAGAAAIVAWMGADIARKLDAGHITSDLLGSLAGIAYGASYAAAFQAIRPEVYALSSLLVLAAIATCLRYVDDPQPAVLARAGLWFGLALTNHHYLALVGAVPPAIALLWPRRPAPGLVRGLLAGALTTCTALLLYLYLPLRSAHDPILRWGHPLDLRTWFWVVSAQSFQKSVTGGARVSDLPLLVGAVLDELGPIASLVGLGGVYVALRKRPRLGLALALALIGPLAARLLLSFDSGNPDAFAYLGTGIAALALCMVPLCAALLSAAPAMVRPVGAALAIVAVGWRAIASLPAMSLAGFEDTRATYAPLLSSQPRGALVVPSYFQTAFSLSYLRVVEGARPDLHFLPRHFLTHPGERAALQREDPTLTPLLGDNDVVPDALRTSERPVFVEYDLDLPASLVERATEIRVPPSLSNELQTRRFVLWQAVLRLHRLCRTGASADVMRDAEVALRAQTDGDRSGGTISGDFVTELLTGCAAARGR